MDKDYITRPTLFFLGLLLLAVGTYGIATVVPLPVESQANKKPQPIVLPNLKVEKTGKLLQTDDTEASWFIWKGELYYLLCHRDIASTQHELRIMRFSDNSMVSSFGKGLSYCAAFVEGDTFYAFGTNSNSYTTKGNSIWKITSKDLISFTEPIEIKKMASDTVVYNVSVTKNDKNEFVMAYEIDTPSLQPFSIKFLKSVNLNDWQEVGGVLGPDEYAACPFIKFHNGYYYVWHLVIVNLPGGGYNYMPRLGRSKDLVNWNFSRIYTIKPTETYEDINTSDLDLIEYNGKIYIIYAIGDQVTYMRLTYATFEGNWEQFLTTYYQGK